ncbi:MAG: response regulator [Phenylobacterium sp.]|uniref:response regulator n=1 Tax=Phenylobacterium sp. TaxID=1871053 RepID=UPI0027365590|nr:response regulator [Phenylobacterium sp.]MDP3747049.1 response regulator [Phenylobacterium sp.]
MGSALTGLRLLIVEDEAMVAMMIEFMLTDLGCVVVDVAGTVSRGLALAGDEALALDGAILDVNLGGEKVYPVAEALRSRHVPFIFSTGYGIDGITEQFAQVPALAKPYEQQTLENMLLTTLLPGASPTRDVAR